MLQWFVELDRVHVHPSDVQQDAPAGLQRTLQGAQVVAWRQRRGMKRRWTKLPGVADGFLIHPRYVKDAVAIAPYSPIQNF